jgi:hypothetical protein
MEFQMVNGQWSVRGNRLEFQGGRLQQPQQAGVPGMDGFSNRNKLELQGWTASATALADSIPRSPAEVHRTAQIVRASDLGKLPLTDH